MNGRHHFDQLVRALQDGEMVPPAVASWFVSAAMAWDCGTEKTLDGALGLRRETDAVAKRDALIGMAAELAPTAWSKSQVARWLANLLDHDEPLDYDRLCLAERLVMRRREGDARRLMREANDAWAVPGLQRLRKLF